MERYYWTANSHDERISAINDLSRIIDRHATILNFQRFSDLSMGLTIELEERSLKLLFAELSEILFIDGYAEIGNSSSKEVLLMLNITFARGTGELVIEVPDFPE